MFFLKRYAAVVVPCLSFIVAFVVMGFCLDDSAIHRLAREDGDIENLTAILFAAASAIGLIVAWRHKISGWYLFSLFMAAAALREVDAHKAWTTMSIFKSRFYVSPDVPIFEKVCGAIIIFALLYGAWRLVPKIAPSLRQARAGVAHVLFIYTALGWLALAKFFDASFRLFPVLEEHYDGTKFILLLAEESLEMSAALLLLLAPVAWVYRKRR